MPAQDEPIPESIGPYRVEEKIGQGGQGRAYKCHDNIGATVVLKCIVGDSPDAPHRVERLRKEAKALGKLRGTPNVVYVHGLHEFGGRLYLETEYIPGDDLSARLRDASFGVREALEACVQIARGLEAAHGAGVLHRDLKPKNVRVTGAGVVKILDFGLALLADRAVNTEATTIVDVILTEEGVRLGTRGYMSPEQVRGRDVDHRTDIWSFGCVLYECLAKRPAFHGESPSDTLIMCLHDEPDMSELPTGVPERVRDLLEKCLRKNRDDRLQHIGDARVDLESALRAMSAPAPDAPIRGGKADAKDNLPRKLPLFVGREQDLDRIAEAMENGRVVALTGVGGSGKSRLAEEFGRQNLGRYPDGVWFIKLASLTGTSQVAPAVARVLLKLPEDPGKMPEGLGAGVETWIMEYVGRKRMLLILDNCEHLVEACSQLVELLLSNCPNLSVLATTRETLGVAGEARIKLEVLQLPDEDAARPEELMWSPAVRLFVGKARQVNERFVLTDENAGAVLQICHRVDGLPLAIILVASWLGAMSVHEVAANLDEVLGMVSEGGKTIEGSIDWSYRRLSEKERLMLQRLSVFEGGWTANGAKEVCVDPGAHHGDAITERDVLRLLIDLVAKSVVDYRQGPQTGKSGRYDLLQMIRAYARKRLKESGDAHRACVSERFVKHIMALARAAEAELKGKKAAECLQELSREYDNIRAAMSLCLGGGMNKAWALELAVNVHRYCYLSGQLEEGAGWLQEAMALRGNAEDDLQANGWNSKGTIMWGKEDFKEAKRCFERCLEIRTKLGDAIGTRQPLHNLALIDWKLRDYDASEQKFQKLVGLYDPEKEVQRIAELRMHLGCVRFDQGKYDEAEELFTWAAETLAEQQRVVQARHNMGEVSYMRGRRDNRREEFEEARRRFAVARQLRNEIGEPKGRARTISWQAMTEVRLGNRVEAEEFFAVAEEIRRRKCIEIPEEDREEYAKMRAETGLAVPDEPAPS